MASMSVSSHHPVSIAPSRDSMAFTSTKGLLNGPGQNNCFLNSAVQVLWHLDIFRRSFRDLSGHACMAESCIFCALKELFSQLQFSHETALPPDALRRALAESFFDQQRFQLGFMDDAAECFENMLLRIHMHIAHGEAEDMCNAKHCIPHQKFAMTLVEQSICGSCGATSEPLSFTQMVHYVSASALTTQGRQNYSGARIQGHFDSFGELLRKAGSMGDIRDCPSQCGAKIQICRTLMNRPEIVSIGVVWDSERPTLEHIMDVFATVGTSLKLGDVFHSVVDNRWAELTNHSLVGVVTYYGKHYSTFFFHTKLRVWIYFDDATVREVGPRWDQVVEKCRRGRYQPLLLLYAVPGGSPVNTDQAPKQITPFMTDKNSNKRNVPSQALLRRSITPSPEKPIIGNTRRAITPNPDCSMIQKPPLPRPYNEYQNLSVIQDNIYSKNQQNGVDCVDGDIGPDYVTRKSMENTMNIHNGHKNSNIQIHRTLSNGSSSGMEGISVPDHLNVPRRRDSGNWSGDRNSASSSSSTTMENPYLYLVGKVPHGNGSVPGSPTRPKCDSSSGSSGMYDAGYDSYSLSSNDSSTMTTIQHLMKMGHLAKIPEDYGNAPVQTSPSCDVLCDEADELLKKSRQLEDEHDLVLALALCNAAATKARAAMNAPYNNPQTLTLARMKHNTCIMRARSLHRRMTQTQAPTTKDNPPEIRHTREGSSGSGRHSRQSSRDKGQHSRQNSKELLVQQPLPQEKPHVNKSIEIYATLPKKKGVLKNKVNINIGEDEEYMIYDKPPVRESRNFFLRSKNKEANKVREKRSRSEDRNKMSRDFSIAPDQFTKETAKKDKNKEEKEEKKDKDKPGKKQHKIRRKLLMGGLIRRKNRSMPDLTEGNTDNDTTLEKSTTSVDDSSIGIKGSDNMASMCGYLSEGHLEFSGSSTNPNLERSRLMRKSFHGSAGKVLAVAKVPPPPPLRTTSQLSKSKLNGGEVCEEKGGRPQYPLPNEINSSNYYHQSYGYNVSTSNTPCLPYNNEPNSLPYMNGRNGMGNYENRQSPIINTPSNVEKSIYYTNQSPQTNQSHTVVIQADVHQEQSPMKQDYYTTYNHNQQVDSGVDEVDCLPAAPSSLQTLDLPPYPSPASSVVHSRQPSEEFPPPPPPLDLSALDEHLPDKCSTPIPAPGSLLAQLQNKRQEILTQDNELKKEIQQEPIRSSGDTWLKELQAKQAALRMKKTLAEGDTNNKNDYVIKLATNSKQESPIASVKDLASRFENNKVQTPEPNPHATTINYAINNETIQTPPLYPTKTENYLITKTTLNDGVDLNDSTTSICTNDTLNENRKHKLTKKKSVSFCDQVILVEEQEEDSYIPNPILERVLRTAMNKPETAAIRKEIISLRESEKQKEDNIQEQVLNTQQIVPDNHIPESQVPPQCPPVQHNLREVPSSPSAIRNPQYVYTRQNSMDNLLSQSPTTNHVRGINENEITVQRQVSTDSRYSHVPQESRNQVYGSSPQNLAYRQSPYQHVSSPQPPYQQVPVNYNKQYGSPMQYPQNYEYNNSPNQYHTTPRSMPSQNSPSVQPNVIRQSPTPNQHHGGYHGHPNNQTSQMSSPYQPVSPPQNQQYYQQNGNHNPNPYPTYQQPPSPSINNPSYNSQLYSQQTVHNRPPPHPQQYNHNNDNRQYNPYQRVPPPNDYPYNNQPYPNSVYQRVPNPDQEVHQAIPLNSPYQRVPPPHGTMLEQYQPNNNGPYQRVPYQETHIRQNNSCGDLQNTPYQQVPAKYSPYQSVPSPKQQVKKVSFEPGTKGGPELQPTITPIIVNNNSANINGAKTKCNLCRKKHVVSPNSLCNDCEFYMSKFKPK